MSFFFLLYYLASSVFFKVTYSSTELPSWHLKPLGSHIKPNEVDETFAENIISAKNFASNYVLQRKPLLFRNIVKEWPAFTKWTDEYLKDKYGDLELRLEGKREKQSGIPVGDICLGRDRMRTFLNEYKSGANKYVVSDLPTPMWHEVKVPPPMACGEFLQNFVEIDLWMNSDRGKKGEGGNSILHKDAFNTINCVVNGSKEWKLIELKYNDFVYQSWEGPLDAGYGGFSLVNPEKVDAIKFPDVGKIPQWQFATVKAGDCIYLPSQMWHQVKSFGSVNRAVSFLFSKFDKVKEIDTTSCKKTDGVLLSDVDVDWPYPGNGIMPMGNSEISVIKNLLIDRILDRKKEIITPKSVFKLVEEVHSDGAKNIKLYKKKAKEMYNYFLTLVNNNTSSLDKKFVQYLTREDIRKSIYWIFPIEPANSYEHEYSYFTPEYIKEIIQELVDQTNDGNLLKQNFVKEYQNRGGTFKFATNLWERMAKDKNEIKIKKISKKLLKHALEKYEYYRREDPDEYYGEDETITTPQGHQSQPRKFVGGYDERATNLDRQPHEEL